MSASRGASADGVAAHGATPDGEVALKTPKKRPSPRPPSSSRKTPSSKGPIAAGTAGLVSVSTTPTPQKSSKRRPRSVEAPESTPETKVPDTCEAEVRDNVHAAFPPQQRRVAQKFSTSKGSMAWRHPAIGGWKRPSAPEYGAADLDAQAGPGLCGKGHRLHKFTSHRDGYFCDLCRTAFPTGSRFESCRECDYDLCGECVRLGEWGADSDESAQLDVTACPSLGIGVPSKHQAVRRRLRRAKSLRRGSRLPPAAPAFAVESTMASWKAQTLVQSVPEPFPPPPTSVLVSVPEAQVASARLPAATADTKLSTLASLKEVLSSMRPAMKPNASSSQLLVVEETPAQELIGNIPPGSISTFPTPTAAEEASPPLHSIGKSLKASHTESSSLDVELKTTDLTSLNLETAALPDLKRDAEEMPVQFGSPSMSSSSSSSSSLTLCNDVAILIAAADAAAADAAAAEAREKAAKARESLALALTLEYFQASNLEVAVKAADQKLNAEERSGEEGSFCRLSSSSKLGGDAAAADASTTHAACAEARDKAKTRESLARALTLEYFQASALATQERAEASPTPAAPPPPDPDVPSADELTLAAELRGAAMDCGAALAEAGADVDAQLVTVPATVWPPEPAQSKPARRSRGRRRAARRAAARDGGASPAVAEGSPLQLAPQEGMFLSTEDSVKQAKFLDRLARRGFPIKTEKDQFASLVRRVTHLCSRDARAQGACDILSL